MSEFLNDKISKLESLDERELTVLNYIMANTRVHITDVTDQMSKAAGFVIGESTVRSYLTNIFKKLGVPPEEGDKRGYVVREYSEAYRERYLKVGEIPSRPQNSPVSEPRIDVSPPGRRVSQRVVIIGIIGGFALISICSIIFLLVFLRVLNRPTPVVHASAMPQIVVEQNTPEPIYQTATPETIVVIPQPVATELPSIPTSLPTPKDFYNQGEMVIIREGVYISLDPDFLTAQWVGCVYNPGFVIQFGVYNKTNNNFLMRFDRYAFSAEDDTGKTYEFKGSGMGMCENTPGTVSITVNSNDDKYFVVAFAGEIPLNARFISITISDISGSGKIVFRKDL